MWYFAYGSNLCRNRLLHRIPAARYEGIARLSGHVLRFHKIGRDGSGKADAPATGRVDDVVWGALVRLTDEDLARLDAFEPGYNRRTVRVEASPEEIPREVVTYLARPESIDPARRPFGWYRDLVVDGGRARGLPLRYLNAIADLPVVSGGDLPEIDPAC